MNWFFAFMTTILEAIWNAISSFFTAAFQLFNFPLLFDQLNRYKTEFGGMGWILCIVTVILAYGIWFAIVFLIVLGVRKYLRFRRTLVGNEDLLEEIADLHRDVVKLTSEKEKLLAMKIDPTGITYDQLREMFEGESAIVANTTGAPAAAVAGDGSESGVNDDGTITAAMDGEGKRFFRLAAGEPF